MRQQKSVQNPAPPISSTLTGTKQPAHRETPTSTTASRITYEQVEKLLNVAAVIVCVIVVGAFLVFIAHELVAPADRFLCSKVRGRPRQLLPRCVLPVMLPGQFLVARLSHEPMHFLQS
jgi:hypothetical protein